MQWLPNSYRSNSASVCNDAEINQHIRSREKWSIYCEEWSNLQSTLPNYFRKQFGMHPQPLYTVCIIEKENNFKQPGERYRSFDPDRQERFICRWVNALSDPRVTHEIRSIWINYWSQADRSLGQKIASRLNVKPSM